MSVFFLFRWRFVRALWGGLGKARVGYLLFGLSYLFILISDITIFFYPTSYNFFYSSPINAVLLGYGGLCCSIFGSLIGVAILMWFFGLIGILRGRAELKIKHANWAVFGVLFCFLGNLFYFLLYIIAMSTNGDTSDSAEALGGWLEIVAFLITFIGLFAFIYNVFPRKGKKVIVVIFCIVFIGAITNWLIAQPKAETMVEELVDYVEEGEDIGYGRRRTPTDVEILDKYDELKKPLIPFVIIGFLFEMSIVIVIMVTFAIFNRAKRGWSDKKESYKYGYNDEEDEEEEDDDEDLNVLERLRRKQQRKLGNTGKMDEEKIDPREMAKKESLKAGSKCIKCSHLLIPADAEFCAICGTNQTKIGGHEPVTHTSRCINCGVELIPTNATFCHICGASQKLGDSPETTTSVNKCIDCGVAIEPPLVFCTMCVAKQQYGSIAESSHPSPIGPAPIKPTDGQYVHQQQMPNISLAPQRYGPQDHFIPKEGGEPQTRTAAFTPLERLRESPPQINLQKLDTGPPTIENSSSPPQPITPPSPTGMPVSRMVSIVCSKCKRNYNGQIISIPSVVDCPFCGTPKIFDSV